MAGIIPPVDVQDPSPQIRRYGMFDAAVGPKPLPVHARGGGIRYQTVTTELPIGFEVLCEDSVVTMTDTCGDTVTGLPFVVMATMTTGTVGMTQADIESSLRQRLYAGEQPVVEDIFCNRLFGASPSLVNNVPNATTLAAALNVVDGIGDLEAWLYARYGPKGVLHIPLALATRCYAMGAIIHDGSTWRTPLGTAVSFGNYSGDDADGDAPAAGHTNLYITGSLTIWRTPDEQVEISPWLGNIALATNQIAAFARREYVVTHNNLIACVDVDIDGAW